jgi:hypothetical protein
MTTANLVQRGWEIFTLGVFCLIVSAAQIVTGRAIVPRRGKLLPDWKPREGYRGHFIWGVLSMAGVGTFSVWYGISELLRHSN